MQRITDTTALPSLPAVPTLTGTTGYFTEGTPGVVAATRARGWWLNMVQEELISLLSAAGVAADTSGTNFTQILQSIRALITTAVAAEITRAEVAEATKGNLAGNNAWSGINTFTGPVIVPVGTASNQAVALGQFYMSFPSVNDGYTIAPGGLVDQTFNAVVTASGTGITNTTITLPYSYAHYILDAIGCFDGTLPPLTIGLSVAPASVNSVIVSINSTGIGVAQNCGVVIRTRGY